MLKAAGSKIAVQPATSPKVRPEPTQEQWEEFVTPPEDQQTPIQVGAKAGRDTFRSMQEVRQALGEIDFHQLDPYVASVASGIDARTVSEPWNYENVYLSVKEFYDEPVTIEVGLENGPEAPMMVILPGVYGGREGGFSKVYKKMALERGMNYAVIPNPLSQDATVEEPTRYPGNPAAEAEATLAILEGLKRKRPEYFDKISLAGYSYGALLAANVTRLDEQREDRLVNGSVVALSPPNNLVNSMAKLDGLRALYASGTDPISATAVLYAADVSTLGYEDFMASPFSERGEGSNLTEIKMADLYGSRKGMEKLVEAVDDHFDHNLLPPRFPDFIEREMALDRMTYDQYREDYFINDTWLEENGHTPESLAAEYSYKSALDAINKTPVLTLLAADDYILKPEDLQVFQGLQVEQQESEPTRIVERGGHLGLLFNPEVQDLMADFTYSADSLNPPAGE